MKKILMFALVLLPLLASVGYAALNQSGDDYFTEQEIKDIAENHPEVADSIREFKKADQELNAVYKMLIDIYEQEWKRGGRQGENEFILKFKAAQLAWLKYRDLAVKSETSIHYSTLEYYADMADLTTQRIERMKSMLTDMSEGFNGKGPYGCRKPAKEALAKIKKMEQEK
ncbi:DUF1311 domain-containing protein [bacterium]|nr:DUF1311 domain-containing protein [bacterium]